MPFPGVTVSAMTKSALLAFTRGLARESGPRDIAGNLVQPGGTDTDMSPADGPNAEGILARTPLDRYGTPDDVAATVAVAATVVFLAGPAARQITGTAVTVDAGLNA